MECFVNNRLVHSLWLSLFALMIFVQNPLHAQEGLKPAQGDEVRWEKAKEGRDYHEVAGPKKEAPDLPNVPSVDFGWVKYLLIAILIAFVVFLLVKTLSRSSNTKVDPNQTMIEELENADEDLASTNLEKLLERALAAGDHRSAVRIRYLMILKDLDTRGLIKHRKDKTNMTYVLELSEQHGRSSFLRITRIFEYVWYGDAALSLTHYSELDPVFTSFTLNLDRA
jgi:hypothetical protein